MKTRIKDISLHCFNFMYKLYGRNTCVFGIEAEFSVPAAWSQSDPYFNVNKRGISFISLSLSSNNKPEKSPLHFQCLVRSWETEQGRPHGSAGPPAPPRMDWKKKEEKRGHVARPKRNGKGLSLRCPFSWKSRAGHCTRRAAGHLHDKSWKEPLNARVLSSSVLKPMFSWSVYWN